MIFRSRRVDVKVNVNAASEFCLCFLIDHLMNASIRTVTNAEKGATMLLTAISGYEKPSSDEAFTVCILSLFYSNQKCIY